MPFYPHMHRTDIFSLNFKQMQIIRFISKKKKLLFSSFDKNIKKCHDMEAVVGGLGSDHTIELKCF